MGYWMNIKRTHKEHELFKYVYSSNEIHTHSGEIYWGKARSFPAISGSQAMQLANAAHVTINGKLIDDCLYIFRQAKKGGLVPYRVSMHPKTRANIEKGSRRYGALSIINELR